MESGVLAVEVSAVESWPGVCGKRREITVLHDSGGCGSEEEAVCGLEIGNDGTAFAPLLLGFEMYYGVC